MTFRNALPLLATATLASLSSASAWAEGPPVDLPPAVRATIGDATVQDAPYEALEALPSPALNGAAPVSDGAANAPSAEPAEAIGEAAEDDLWVRIRAGFAMEEVESALVQRHEAWYLNRPDYVQRMIERSRRYLFHIVEEVEKRGMPSEIALLPMIESAYNPVALSRMRAAGIWQFIPSTGRKYGLKQTWWYDGRRDVLAATGAALDYLQFLHGMFGDWELALAAYNCGEGAVQRAIARNRAKGKRNHYTGLALPKETRNYLPKLQAVKNIIANPGLLGIELEPLPNRPYFVVVKAPAHIDVAMAAKLAEVPVEEFRYLNPGHTRPVITPVANRQLLVPADKAELFHANLESNDEPLVSWQTYSLKNGEKLETIARKFGISVQRLKEVNGLTGRKRIRPGDLLLVPLEGDHVESNLDETYDSKDFQAPAEDYARRTTYRVKPGDTLYEIARRHGVTVARIKAWNHLRSNQIRVGQRLALWKEADVRAAKHRVVVR